MVFFSFWSMSFVTKMILDFELWYDKLLKMFWNDNDFDYFLERKDMYINL